MTINQYLLKNITTFTIFLVLVGCKTKAPTSTGLPSERNREINNPSNGMIIRINEPETLQTGKPTQLIFFALPNGNSIEWTMGKKMEAGDDWHYDIQHIAAQTRYVRSIMQDQQVVVIYLANQLKSWPAWKRLGPERPAEIKRVVDSLIGSYQAYQPKAMLNSHSGGGSLLFGYLDAVEEIPEVINAIAFIDSDYGYEDSMHTHKLAHWLNQSKQNRLSVLAYNDSVVVFNGKPLVSPHGGTWYRTQWMQRSLARTMDFTRQEDSLFIHFKARRGQVDIHLKKNPAGLIYHTEQVARNGFIHTVLHDTRYARKARYNYWGERVYNNWIW